MRTVGQAVAGLRDPASLAPTLRALGAAHAKYGVVPVHFDVVGDALLWTLESALHPQGRWTPATADAWAKAWTLVRSVMQPALVEATERAAAKSTQ